MQLNKQNIYFIGIGGIGMSALARYFVANGNRVAGYDRTETEITKSLQSIGVDIHFEDTKDNVPETFLNPEITLIVYTPAIPKTHNELSYFQSKGFTILKRSQVLGEITKNTSCLAVAGTHGKTTTTSILGHLMHECGIEVTAFLGGISENYNSNLILKGTKVSVVEADEFDRSFLTLHPDLLCITSMDADHLDIYGKREALEDSFKAFAKQVKPGGAIFVRNGLSIDGLSYGIEDDSDYRIENINIKNGKYIFDVFMPDIKLEDLEFSLPGRHNLLNALVALAMAAKYGCPHDQLAKALASYKGVKRRFSIQIKTEDFVFIDDYAHHPEEINAVHQAISEMFPDKKVLVIFQPHLYSRTKDFVEEFAMALAKFDKVVLLPIYPARELPIEGVTSDWLLGKVQNANKSLIRKEELIDFILNENTDILLTIGAGDIGEEVQSIKHALQVAS